MSIDSAGFSEDIVTLLTFLAILLIALFSGYFGPKPFITEYAIETFEKATSHVPPKFAYSILNLSSFSKSLTISLIMERKRAVNPTNGGVSVLVEGSAKSTVNRLYSKSFTPIQTEFSDDDIYSKSVVIFSDQAVDYSLVTVQLSFPSVEAEYNGVKILFVIGNAEFVVYEMIFRILFSISLICFLFLMVLRLKAISFKNWYLEQKLTLMVLLIVACYNNPLYGLKFVNWHVNYVIDSFFRGLTISSMYFFLVSLFDGLRFKNRETGGIVFFTKFLLSVFIGILTLTEGFLLVFINIKDSKYSDSLTDWVPKVHQLILPSFTVAALYLLVVIILSFKEVDPTERFKLNLYVVTLAICILAALVGYRFNDDNALTFTIQYAIVSLFSIMMAYYHWPYEVRKDLLYDQQKHDVLDSRVETAFIINEESDN